MLALIHYVTNYATKQEAPIHHILVLAASVKKRLRERGLESLTDDSHNPDLERGYPPAPGVVDDKFILRCFNKLSSDREISGVQVAATVLGYPESYTPERFSSIHLGSLGTKIVRDVGRWQQQDILSTGTSEDTEEYVTITDCNSPGTGPFDDYMQRGPVLSAMCLYDYKSTVVRQKRSQYSGGKGINFQSTHQFYLTYSQRVVSLESEILTVKFNGRMFHTLEQSEQHSW